MRVKVTQKGFRVSNATKPGAVRQAAGVSIHSVSPAAARMLKPNQPFTETRQSGPAHPPLF